MAGDNLALVSLSDGTDCKQCVVRMGVITGGQDEDESDGDPAPLNARFSVLGISYHGSERVYFGSAVGTQNTDANDDGSTTDEDQSDVTFTVNLDARPADMNAELPGVQHDIRLVTLPRTVIFVAAVVDTNSNNALTATSSRVNGSQLTITIDPDDLTIENAPDTTDIDESRILATDFFDVTYTREVGALVRNALDPDAKDTNATDPADDRPVIAVSPGSRVRITSANDAVEVDAEKDGPRYGNAEPSSSTGSTDATIAVTSPTAWLVWPRRASS